MSDIFFSYAREDMPRIQSIVEALYSVGWSVWWERTILPGQTFDQAVGEALDSARCIVVAWSRNSISSKWVRAEAGSGLQRGVLVPCLLDTIEPPPGFRTLQSVSLADWRPGAPNRGIDGLIQAVAHFCPPPLKRGMEPFEDRAELKGIHVDTQMTLTAAVELAGTGDQLLIEEGTYKESLVFEKPIQLVGVGNRDKTIIESYDFDVMLSGAPGGRIANLTIRYLGNHASALKIVDGSLLIEDCQITSKGLACISIQHDARPVVRRNRIHDGRQEGIYVGEGAAGIIESNDIGRHGLAGIAIWRGASPEVRRNEIWGSSEGIYVGNGGRGVIEHNRIHDNRRSGIQVNGGEPELRSNEVFRNGPEGS